MGVPHVRVELQGTLVSGAEKWSTGFSTAPPAGGAVIDAAALATSAQTLFKAQWDAAFGFATVFPLSTAFTGARVQQLEADGTILASAEAVLAAPDAGSAELALPPQCAVVLSLRTGLSGARYRGRMYLPGPGASGVTSVGRLQSSVQEALALRMHDFMSAWNTAHSAMPVGVASGMGGFVTTVTQLQVGNIVDTQRRRRDALPEGYVSIAL